MDLVVNCCWDLVVCLVVVGVVVGVDSVCFMVVAAGVVGVVIRCVTAVGGAGRCVGGPGFWMGKTVVGESEISKSTDVSTFRETVKDRI